MTSHQFAKELLAGPDLFIMVPKVKKYSDNEDDCCAFPSVSKQEGHNNITDQPCEVLVISYRADGGGGRCASNRKRKSANVRISDGANVDKP